MFLETTYYSEPSQLSGERFPEHLRFVPNSSVCSPDVVLGDGRTDLLRGAACVDREVERGASGGADRDEEEGGDADDGDLHGAVGLVFLCFGFSRS